MYTVYISKLYMSIYVYIMYIYFGKILMFVVQI